MVPPSQAVMRFAEREARAAACDQALVERAAEPTVRGVPFLCAGRGCLVELLGWVVDGRVDALVPVTHVAAVDGALVRRRWVLVLGCWVGGRFVGGRAW